MRDIGDAVRFSKQGQLGPILEDDAKPGIIPSTPFQGEGVQMKIGE